MPAAHIVSFMPLDYRIRDPLHFAASFAAAGWSTHSIEVDGCSNHFRRFEDHGIDRLQLPFGREKMALPFHVVRRVARYVYFFLVALLF